MILGERFKSFKCFSEVLLIHTGLWNLFGDLMRRDFLMRLPILLVFPGGQIWEICEEFTERERNVVMFSK